jgi:SAM-dependent methyltransferase
MGAQLRSVDRVSDGGSGPLAGRCAACGHTRLEPHLSVRHDPGPKGLIPTTDQFGAALSDIVRCPVCGHMQLGELPRAAHLLERYTEAESADYVEEEAGQRATAQAALEAVERHAKPGALLDVGCWVGFLLAEARSRGWNAVGLEPSEFASSYAREVLGLDVRCADLFGADIAPGSFDAVVLADVLEHLPDPRAALDRISTLMRPGGALYLALPDAGSRVARVMGRHWWSVIPTHVQYFTRASLATLLSRDGWGLVELATAPKAFTVGYYLSRSAGYSERLSRSLVGLARAAGVADRMWSPDFRDRMAAVALAPSGSSLER